MLPSSHLSRHVGSEPAGVVHLPIPSTDAALVAALKSGRITGAATLFDRYESHVQRVLVRVLGPDPDLLDLTQDVFVAALESIHRLDEPTALKAWLARIAVYTARGRIRRRSRWRFVRTYAPEDLPETEAVVAGVEISEALRKTYQILELLPADHRIAFALRFIDGMELTHVADACGVSLATVKRRLLKAQKQFVDLARKQPALVEWVHRGARWKL